MNRIWYERPEVHDARRDRRADRGRRVLQLRSSRRAVSACAVPVPLSPSNSRRESARAELRRTIVTTSQLLFGPYAARARLLASRLRGRVAAPLLVLLSLFSVGTIVEGMAGEPGAKVTDDSFKCITEMTHVRH